MGELRSGLDGRLLVYSFVENWRPPYVEQQASRRSPWMALADANAQHASTKKVCGGG